MSQQPLQLPSRTRIPRDGDLIAVPGAPGMGKTTTICRGLMRDVVQCGRRALLLDTTGDMVAYLTRGSAAGGPTMPEAWIQRATNTAEVFRAPETKRVVALTVVGKVDIEDLAETFLNVMDDSRTETWVTACDEGELAWQSGQARGVALRVLKLLRNRRQRLYLAFQRPQAVATIARSNATYVLAHGGDSRAYVAGCAEFGDPSLYERVLTLPKYSYLYRDRWREDRMAALPIYDGKSGPLPWPA
jgi:hypothetical protein